MRLTVLKQGCGTLNCEDILVMSINKGADIIIYVSSV